MSNINFNNGMFRSNTFTQRENFHRNELPTDNSFNNTTFSPLNNLSLPNNDTTFFTPRINTDNSNSINLVNQPIPSEDRNRYLPTFKNVFDDDVILPSEKNSLEFIQKLANALSLHEFDIEKCECFYDNSSQLVGWGYQSDNANDLFKAGTINYNKDGSMVIKLFNGEKINIKTDSKKNETTITRYDTEEKPLYAIKYNKKGEICAEFLYNSQGNISSGTRINKETNEITRYEYNNGLLESYTKENNPKKGEAKVITYYDKNNKKLKETYDTRIVEREKGYIKTTEYNSDGSVASITTKWDRPDKNKDVAKQVVTFVPSDDGAETKEITKYYDFKDREITINYNEQNKETSYTCIDKNGETLYEKKYNEKGNLVAEYMYKNGKLDSARLLDINGNIIYYNYDENGNIISTVQENMPIYKTPTAESSEYNYSNIMRTYTKFDPKTNETIKYSLDLEGNPLSATRYDENGNMVAEFKYNQNGQIIYGRRWNNDGTVSTYKYDDKGNLETKTISGTYISTVYDAQGNVLQKNYFNPAINCGIEKEIHNQDGSIDYFGFNGEKLEIQHDEKTNETIVISFDSEGKAKSENRYDASGRLVSTLSHDDTDILEEKYDEKTNEKIVIIRDSDGKAKSANRYDASGKLVATFTYDRNGKIKSGYRYNDDNSVIVYDYFRGNGKYVNKDIMNIDQDRLKYEQNL